MGDPNELSSAFPSFRVDKSLDLGFLAYGGDMAASEEIKIGRYIQKALTTYTFEVTSNTHS